ncbi:MAG: ABC transporter ATP-binding protein [Collinsella sp.]|nr:ABC transporter ATP-binding protein [Collinsella sp.]
MLAFSDLTIGINGKTLLSCPKGAIPAGKVTSLVAPNGSGKTTFMRALIDADGVKRTGKIVADGVPISQKRDYRKLVFYVPGDASILYPLLTVRENLMMVHRCWGASVDLESFARKCRIDGFLDKRVRNLSLGMKQQASLAAGYLTGARYLLLDEPMNALDPTNLEINSRIIRTLCGKGVGILMSSHILGNVDTLSDKIVFIKNGSFVSAPEAVGGSQAMYRRLYG